MPALPFLRSGLALMLAVSSFSLAHAAEAPAIVSRDQWGAKPPILARMKKQTPHEIIIHHTGVRQQPQLSLERKLRGLQSYSQREKGWGDSPYHYYIDVSGRIGEARDVAYAGDTNTPYGVKDRALIVLEGHFDTETPKPEQIAALKQLIAWLSERYAIPGNKISGHNDHVATDCPGKNLKALLPELRQSAAAP